MNETDHHVRRTCLIAASLGLAMLALQACSHGPITAPQIVAFGPHTVKAGVVFARQPNGQAALWLKTADDLVLGAVIVLNGAPLKTHVNGNHATAWVPAELYAKAGSYPLQINETVGTRQLQSNIVQFVVK